MNLIQYEFEIKAKRIKCMKEYRRKQKLKHKDKKPIQNYFEKGGAFRCGKNSIKQ